MKQESRAPRLTRTHQHGAGEKRQLPRPPRAEPSFPCAASVFRVPPLVRRTRNAQVLKNGDNFASNNLASNLDPLENEILKGDFVQMKPPKKSPRGASSGFSELPQQA